MSETSNQKMSPPWTILKVLRWTAGYFEKEGIDDSPRLDAELLLASVLDVERVKLYANFNQPLQQDELNEFKSLMKRRIDGEPVAYITGYQQFWSIDLKVDERALIPRPETERVVSSILDFIDEGDEKKLLDVGTGTGAIVLAVADERPSVSITATDVSSDAMELARENAEHLGFEDRIEFVESDLFEEIDSTFDVIVSNPPYVSTQAYEQEVSESIREYEPKKALEAGEAGLDILKRLVPDARKYLEEEGHLICEIGYDQGKEVKSLFENAGYTDIEVGKDEAQRDRLVFGVRRGESGVGHDE